MEQDALGDAVKELLSLGQLWHFMLPGKGTPCFPGFEDNQGALRLAQNPATNSKSKHTGVHHHCFKDLVHQGGNSVIHIAFEYKHADIVSLVYDVLVAH